MTNRVSVNSLSKGQEFAFSKNGTAYIFVRLTGGGSIVYHEPNIPPSAREPHMTSVSFVYTW